MSRYTTADPLDITATHDQGHPREYGTSALEWLLKNVRRCNAQGSSSWRAEEIPPVALDVEEHGELAIHLDARFGHEHDFVLEHPLSSRLKVVDA